METAHALQDIGLSEQEAACYLALLSLGKSLASQVAKKMDIKRTTVYPILSSLTKKGFAKVYFRDNTRYYYPQHPERAVKIVERKVDQFRKLIPELKKLEHTGATSLGVRYIETKKELEEFYFSMIDELRNKPKKERAYCSMGDTPSWLKAFPEGMARDFWSARASAGIRTRVLITENSRSINPEDPTLLREYRVLPDRYPMLGAIDVFSDQVSIISPELRSLAVVIQVPVMAMMFQSVFDMVWDMVGGK